LTGKDLPGKLQLPRGRQLKKGRLFLLSFFSEEGSTETQAARKKAG
jgi:hypothetical protein